MGGCLRDRHFYFFIFWDGERFESRDRTIKIAVGLFSFGWDGLCTSSFYNGDLKMCSGFSHYEIKIKSMTTVGFEPTPFRTSALS